MRSKTALPLIEKLVMLLVFALSAALCLRLFLWSDQTAKTNAARDQAVLHAQNAAELLKYYKGNFPLAAEHMGSWDGENWVIFYDQHWQEIQNGGSYCLLIHTTEDTTPLLGSATAQVTTTEGEELFSIPICWQEVRSHGE